MTKVGDSVSVSVRTSLSIQLVQSAALFCRHAHACEASWEPKSLEPEARDRARSEHRSYALEGIFSSAIFLEAMINELFAEAGDEFRENLSDIPTEKLSLLVQAGRGGAFTESNARYTILAKYEEFLTILDRPSFNRGAEVYQNASCLIALRNALIHYKPE